MYVPEARIRLLRDANSARSGQYVLYWMTAARRTSFNFALERALQLCRELDRPLLVLEALRVGYSWASDRLHQFVLEGMVDNAARFGKAGVRYYPYVEPEPGAGAGLLRRLAKHACAVVCDDSPAFFLPRMLASAAQQVDVRLEAVDGCGLLPLALAQGRAFTSAHSFRRFVHKNIDHALGHLPRRDPLAGAHVPALQRSLAALERTYPPAALSDLPSLIAALPIDHQVTPVASSRGGQVAARSRLRAFVRDGLAGYAEQRNHPDASATSGLSAHLHFGHVSAHEIFHAVCQHEQWDGLPAVHGRLGGREGFWGMSSSAEAFLDQLITWRELSFNAAAHLPHYDRYESLPAWAQRSLAAHTLDARPALYTLEQLERAQTDDPLWNAAQNELLREGSIHNYMRMLWGKKVIAWSEEPRVALQRLIYLNDKYALDGRDPNSTAGIFWTFGRYDRPWGPERAVFGTVRYMSSASARKKLKLRAYLAQFGTAGA